MPAALAIPAIIGAAGSIGSSLIGANAQGNAAATQQQAANKVIGLTNTAVTNAQNDVSGATQTANTGLANALGTSNSLISSALQNQLADLAPYIQSGQVSLGQVQALLGPNGPLAGPNNQFSFNPQTSPQLQFEQQQANQALMRQAAATGTGLSGGTIRASDALNTGLASSYLNEAFNQALAQYNTNRQNVLTQIQGLTGLTGLGFNATGAANQDIGVSGQLQSGNTLNVAGQQAQNTIGAGMYSGNTGLTGAQIDANAIIGAANARSASQLGQGNIWGGLVNSLGGAGAGLYGLAAAPGPPASSQPGWTDAASAASQISNSGLLGTGSTVYV